MLAVTLHPGPEFPGHQEEPSTLETVDKSPCPATASLPSGELLVCDLDAPHPGVLHLDRPRNYWWDMTDEGLIILGPEIGRSIS